jgi:hypothetical protein
MHRPKIAVAVAMCFAVLMPIAFAAPVAFGATKSDSGIPAGFRAQSVSWVSPAHGWMLGVAPCGQTTCTTVDGTTDGGATWNKLGTLNAPLILEQDNGVTEIRFADDLHGWAFGPALWATTNGGVTWMRQHPPGGAHRVLALAGDSDAVYAVVTACRINHVCHDRATLWRTTAAGGPWTQVSVTLPVSSFAVLAVHGIVAYAVVQSGELDPDALLVTVDGDQWSSRPDPCDKTKNEFLTDVAPVTATKVALMCVANIGFSQAIKGVFRSNDNAQTTSAGSITPWDGITSELAAAPNGTLVVTSWGAAGSWIYRSTGEKSWTTPVAQPDGGVGWNDVVFTTNAVGFVVYGPAAVYPGNRVGELWKTQDGGVTWAPV